MAIGVQDILELVEDEDGVRDALIPAPESDSELLRLFMWLYLILEKPAAQAGRNILLEDKESGTKYMCNIPKDIILHIASYLAPKLYFTKKPAFDGFYAKSNDPTSLDSITGAVAAQRKAQATLLTEMKTSNRRAWIFKSLAYPGRTEKIALLEAAAAVATTQGAKDPAELARMRQAGTFKNSLTERTRALCTHTADINMNAILPKEAETILSQYPIYQNMTALKAWIRNMIQCYEQWSISSDKKDEILHPLKDLQTKLNKNSAYSVETANPAVLCTAMWTKLVVPVQYKAEKTTLFQILYKLPREIRDPFKRCFSGVFAYMEAKKQATQVAQQEPIVLEAGPGPN